MTSNLPFQGDKKELSLKTEMVHDVLISIPTAPELSGILEALRSVLQPLGFSEPKRHSHIEMGTRLLVRDVGGEPFRVTVYCEDYKGNTLTAAHTSYLCTRLRPKLIISAGIAGALNPKEAWIGDVVLPNCVEYGSLDKVYQDATRLPASMQGNPASIKAINQNGVDFESPVRLAPRREQTWPGSTMIINGMSRDALHSAITYDPLDQKKKDRDRWYGELSKELSSRFAISASAPEQPRVLTGVKTFSWDKVLDSRDVYHYLLKEGRISEEAVCVEMESWGFLQATELSRRFNTFDSLIVRGISDIVGCKSVTNDTNDFLEGDCRRLAMENVAKIIGQIVADQCP